MCVSQYIIYSDPTSEDMIFLSWQILPIDTACALSHFSRVWLCDPMDYSLPGSPVHGILQAEILEWVAMPSSKGSSLPRDQTYFSYVSWISW